jgi:hypothetical protein
MVDSDFVLPSKVTLQFDLKNPNNTNINADEIAALGNNPHVGSTIPQAFEDVNLNSKPDDKAVSGYISASFYPCIQLISPILARSGNCRTATSFAR